MLTNRTFKFVNDGDFEPGYSVATQLQSVRLQMRHVAESDEMCDEAQTLLALLQLSEQYVIRVNAVRHSL